MKTIRRKKSPCVFSGALTDALTYEEREEEVEEEEKLEDVEIGLEAMVDKYGLQKVMDTVARMSEEGLKTLTGQKEEEWTKTVETVAPIKRS